MEADSEQQSFYFEGLHCSIIRHYSANACLLPLCQLHGAAVTTVEGVGSTRTRIHPVQVEQVTVEPSQTPRPD